MRILAREGGGVRVFMAEVFNLPLVQSPSAADSGYCVGDNPLCVGPHTLSDSMQAGLAPTNWASINKKKKQE